MNRVELNGALQSLLSMGILSRSEGPWQGLRPVEVRLIRTSTVQSRVAEGSRRRHAQDYTRLLNLAEGSAAETEYVLLLSREIGRVMAERMEAEPPWSP